MSSQEERRSSWRMGDHNKSRIAMKHRITELLLKRKRNPTAKWNRQLPHKVRVFEEKLFNSAASLEEYEAEQTLKARLRKVAMDIAQDYQKRRPSESSVLSMFLNNDDAETAEAATCSSRSSFVHGTASSSRESDHVHDHAPMLAHVPSAQADLEDVTNSLQMQTMKQQEIIDMLQMNLENNFDDVQSGEEQTNRMMQQLLQQQKLLDSLSQITSSQILPSTANATTGEIQNSQQQHYGGWETSTQEGGTNDMGPPLPRPLNSHANFDQGREELSESDNKFIFETFSS